MKGQKYHAWMHMLSLDAPDSINAISRPGPGEECIGATEIYRDSMDLHPVGSQALILRAERDPSNSEQVETKPERAEGVFGRHTRVATCSPI
jgi:hypothetical protein